MKLRLYIIFKIVKIYLQVCSKYQYIANKILIGKRDWLFSLSIFFFYGRTRPLHYGSILATHSLPEDKDIETFSPAVQ